MNLQELSKKVIVAGLFLIPIVPFYVTSALFFPFITGKAFMFRILVEIIFGFWLILCLEDKSYRPQKSWIIYAMSIFVGLIAISDIFSGHFLKSFWSNFERMEGLVTLLHLLAYLLVLVSFVKTEKMWQKLLQTSVGVSILIGFWGLFQFFGKFTSIQSGHRLDGSFGNASYLAIYMLFHIFITAFLLSRYQGQKFVKWLYAAIIAFQTFILFFTATRGTILALVGGLLITLVLVLIFERERLRLRKISAGLLLLLVVLGGLFVSLRESDFVKGIDPLRRLASISLNEKTTASRFLIWEMAYEGFKEKPIFGWGQENFIFVFEKYYNPAMYAQEPWFDRAHNVFFDWLIAGGALGILAYLSLFVISLINLWRSKKLNVLEKSLFVGLLVGYFFHNLFVFDNIASYMMFILTIALIDFYSRDEESSVISSKSFDSKIFTPIILLVIIFCIYFFNVKGILTSRTLLLALTPQAEGPAKNLELYKKALSYNTYGNQEIREQLVSASNAVITLDVPVQVKEQFVLAAREEMQKQIDENPMSARHQVFMGSFLNRLRLYGDAVPYLEKALEISPKKQQIYFELITNHIASNQVPKAIEYAKKAFELDKNFDVARNIYAVSLIYGGNSVEAEKLITERYGEPIVGDDILARAYFDVGEYKKSIAVWKKAIESDPNNLQYRTSLAAVYLASGLREESVNELQKAIEINPEFKAQGEFFIKEIQAGRNP
jgi:O-antigen ligase/tetratricopeptide (TPR) repeat protein